MNKNTSNTVSTVVFAFAWLVVFFTSSAEYGAGTAAVAATFIAIVLLAAWRQRLETADVAKRINGRTFRPGLRMNQGISRRRCHLR